MHEDWLKYAKDEREAAMMLEFYDGLPLLERSVDEICDMSEQDRRALYEETIQAAEKMSGFAQQYASFLPAIIEALIVGLGDNINKSLAQVLGTKGQDEQNDVSKQGM